MNPKAKQFLDAVRTVARYWANESRAESRQEVADGVAFSILNLIDGTSAQCNGIDLVQDGETINEGIMLHEFYHA